MSAIRIAVTAEHIAACALVPDVGDGFKTSHPDQLDPVELAIAEATGQAVICDQDVETEMATIGSGHNVLVVDLPPEQAEWIDRYYKGEPVEPFDFDIEIEDWLARLIYAAAPDKVAQVEVAR